MFREVDVEVDSDGDLVIAGNGDLKVATSEQTLKQTILFRVKTDHNEYTPYPYIGANLSPFVEEANTPRKGQAIVDAIVTALTNDPAFSSTEIFVDAVPLSKTDMGVIIVYTGQIDGSPTGTLISASISKTLSSVDIEQLTNTSEL